ncbi:MAG: CPBP family intramembrane metalloprotease [Crocinitomicaceae bacterium]|nr:CPBP family intramembrane metalloprotease [Crocinitomicaceae bacterium]MBT5402446.1 CPBP family intramembrane metalloprotease [Crocinitomicaceae bacterium]MBT6514929.1 CPBP family intramembrane metalloprotease [Crocinitomicaceae bacterium]
MFIEQAKDGRNKWWKYLVGILIVFVGWQVIGAIPLMSVLFSKIHSVYQLENLQNPVDISNYLGALPFLILTLLMFVFGLLALWFWIRYGHKRKFRSLISVGRTNYKKVFTAFMITMLYNGVFLISAYFNSPDSFQWHFDFSNFLILFLICIFLLPFQTSFEEILFRGYLFQWLFALIRNKYLPLLITSVLFGFLHSFNPEVDALGWLSMIYYIGFGLFMGLITIMDDGLELAIGFHWATNFVGFCFVSNDWGVIQTQTILKNTADPSLFMDMVLPTILLPVMYLIFSKMYKWRGISMLFAKVKLSETAEGSEAN